MGVSQLHPVRNRGGVRVRRRGDAMGKWRKTGGRTGARKICVNGEYGVFRGNGTEQQANVFDVTRRHS